MSQTNTNTNNDQNWNQISRRGGRGQGASNGSGRDNCRNGRGNNSTAKYTFEGKMKDGPISKLIITKTGYQPTQYKKIIDTLPVLCADKNYRGIDDVIQTENDLVETDFMTNYPDADQWSTTRHVEIETINPNDAPDAVPGLGPCTVTMTLQTHVF